jgi:DNA polymerase-3 subunit delta'
MIVKKPLINPASDLVLTLMLRDMPQALLLTGPTGVGLGTVAKYLAGQIGTLSFVVLPEKDEKVDIEKGVISVDSIRRLYTQTRSIQTGKIVILIDYAERMGIQAQNAFLKLLEEPSAGVHFILATHTPSKLLATITSRAQSVEIKPVLKKQTEELLDELSVTDAKKRQQLIYMATGLPAELTRLASDEAYFTNRSTIMRDARDLLQANTYRKLQVANSYRDNRDGALTLLDYTASILKHSISDKPQESLINQLDALLFARQQIEANGNIRICLARFVI